MIQQKKHLYNVALCYHGIVQEKADVLAFRTWIEDFKEQIDYCRKLGYKFVTPTEFYDWYENKYETDQPIATIHFDDALDSVEIAGDWLVQEKIPFGIPIITARQRKRSPESGFMAWAKLKEYIDSGFMEIIYHTHNGHHVILSMNEWDEVVSSPLLEKPSYTDNGINLYLDETATKRYFDFSLVQEAWGFGLFGTDPATGNMVNSKIEFTATKDMDATLMRAWASLHSPASVGYDCDIEIRINGTVVLDSFFPITDYGTRAQWKEREFVSIEFDRPYSMKAGQRYSIEFRTKNKGNGAFMIYSIPDFDGATRLYSSCTGLDLPPNIAWHANPCIILGDGTGARDTDEQYYEYIKQDFAMWDESISKYLTAVWTEYTNYTATPYDNLITIAGTYSNGQTVDTWVKFKAEQSMTTELFSFHYGARKGTRYPVIVDMYIGDIVNGQKVNERLLKRFTPNWADYKQFDVEIPDTSFIAGQEYYLRFKTLNKSVEGVGLVTMTYQKVFPPEPYWAGGETGGWVFTDTWEHEVWGEVLQNEHTDTYPVGWYTDSTNNWQYTYTGKTILGYPRMGFLNRVSNPVPKATQVCFPFGAYYDIGTGLSYPDGSKVTVHPSLRKILQEMGYTGGWSIYPTRFERLGKLREPPLRYDNFALPRFMIYGDIPNEVVLNNLAHYIGDAFQPIVTKSGVNWQTSVEGDEIGNATIRHSSLDFIAWDAYFFRENGIIETGNINQEDLAISRQKGNTNVLIISNYSPAVGMPDGAIAWEVLNWQEQYIVKIVEIITTEGWDGCYLNLEWVYPSDRDNLTLFVKTLARRLHEVGKLLHQTVPAITGTSYDSEWWTGAFDYAELIKHVDAMKIMTYTEATDDQPPQPHSPDAMFDQVYDYFDSIVPAKYKPRLYVGANAYARIWSYETDMQGVETVYARYTSYANALAEAIRLGAEIKPNVNGEGYWEKITKRQRHYCYFGTPATMQRAINKALEKGYGGVGIWKADDGDILEHFPQYDSSKLFQKSTGINKLKDFTWG